MNIRFQPKVCDVYHDMTKKSMKFNNLWLLMLQEIIIRFVFGASLNVKLWIEWKKEVKKADHYDYGKKYNARNYD